MKHRVLIALGLMLPLIIYLPFLDQFALPANSQYSDLLITHYPNALYIFKTVSQWHEIPLWSNVILSGHPFASNSMAGLWYPPGWLALVSLPQPYGFNIGILLHVFWGGMGFYLLLKRSGNSTKAALFGALAFECMPKLMAHWAAGHITLIYAVSWTPWLLWAENYRASLTQKPVFRYLPGIILGLIILADIRWLPLAGLVWFVYGLVRTCIEKPNFSRLRYWFTGAFQLGLQLIIAFMISSPVILPLLEYIPLTTRQDLRPADGLIFSLPPSKLLGLLLPDLGGYAEWVIYPGAIVVFMLILNLAVPVLRKSNWGWLVLAAASLVFALGESIPGMDNLISLPGLNLLRVPSRAMFLFGIAAAILTATGIDWLLHDPEWKFDPAFFMTPLPVFAIMLTVGLWFVSHEIVINFLWGAVALTGSLIAVFAVERRWLPRSVWWGIAVVILLGDLVGVNLHAVRFRSMDLVLDSDTPLTHFLQIVLAQSPGRIYSPSYSVQQQTAALLGFELADGVDPMQLSNYSKYMALATGVPSNSYSVTIPAYAGNPEIANRNYVPDAEKLGLLNIEYIVAAFPIISGDLELLTKLDAVYIYRNLRARPRAWLQITPHQWDENAIKQIILTPNRISIWAEGPGLLVLSELYYPGWIVTVDSTPAKIEIVSGIIRGVNLQAGSHHIEFIYRPLSVYCGLLLAIGTWIILVIVLIKRVG